MLASPAPSRQRAVLEDATGRRRRWMRRAGRAAALLLLGWLVVLLLAGLGLAPVGDIPFGNALRPSEGPEPVAALPKPRKPPPEDLRPAQPQAPRAAPRPQPTGVSEPLPVTTAARTFRTKPRAKRSSPSEGGRPVARSRRPIVTAPPPVVTATPTRPARGRSVTAPGHASTTPPGQSRTTPGHTGAAPPGQIKATVTTTTAPGRSRSVPGHSKTTTTSATTTSEKVPKGKP